MIFQKKGSTDRNTHNYTYDIDKKKLVLQMRTDKQVIEYLFDETEKKYQREEGE